jgi:hypothetical protein
MTTISYHRDGRLIHRRDLTGMEAGEERLRVVIEMGQLTPDRAREEMASRRRKCSPCGSQDPNLGDG